MPFESIPGQFRLLVSNKPITYNANTSPYTMTNPNELDRNVDVLSKTLKFKFTNQYVIEGVSILKTLLG